MELTFFQSIPSTKRSSPWVFFSISAFMSSSISCDYNKSDIDLNKWCKTQFNIGKHENKPRFVIIYGTILSALIFSTFQTEKYSVFNFEEIQKNENLSVFDHSFSIPGREAETIVGQKTSCNSCILCSAIEKMTLCTRSAQSTHYYLQPKRMLTRSNFNFNISIWFS